MIEEVLKDIKEAESNADALQKEAYQKGKDIVLDAELQAEKQKKNTVNGCKAEMRKAMRDAEKNVASVRSEILAEGEKDASKLKAAKQTAVDAASDKILNAFLSKY